MTAFEDIAKKQKQLSILYRIFLILLLLTILLFAGWILMYFGQGDKLSDRGRRSGGVTLSQALSKQ
jgi:hypothetical protein